MNEYKFTNDYHEVVILKKHFSNNILLHISRDTHKQNMNDALQLKQGKKSIHLQGKNMKIRNKS